MQILICLVTTRELSVAMALVAHILPSNPSLTLSLTTSAYVFIESREPLYLKRAQLNLAN